MVRDLASVGGLRNTVICKAKLSIDRKEEWGWPGQDFFFCPGIELTIAFFE